MEEVFKLLKRKESTFENFEEEYIEVDAVSIELPEQFLEITLPRSIKTISVPITIKKLIEDFCHLHSEFNALQLLYIIAGAQNLYRTYRGMKSNNPLIKQFENLQKDLSYLLDLLKEYQFGDRNFISDLRLKHKGHTVNNFFLFEDVFIGLRDLYKLDVESPQDFDKRARVLLKETNQLRYSKAYAYAKIKVAEAFNYILRNLNVNDHTRNIYIGVFFSCAQIPIGKSDNSLLSPKWGENLDENEPKNIWNLLNRPPKTVL